MAESKEYTAIIAVPTYADLETADRTKLVFVNDATADPTVDRGGAMYNYSQTEHRWVKRYEEESMDLKTTKVTGFSYIPIYTLKESECDGYRRVVRIDTAMKAYEQNYVDKITKAAYDQMAHSLDRIEKRISGAAEEKDKSKS